MINLVRSTIQNLIHMKYLFTLLFICFSLLAFSQTTEIYVSDAGNFNNPPWQILKFDANGQNPSVFISTNLNWPQDILFIEDSNTVLISNLGSNKITKHNATTGAYISDFAGSIGGPTRMKIGPDSLLYVLQWVGTGKVRRYDLSGNYLGEFTSVSVAQSIGLDWDQSGNLYVSSFGGDLVRKFDTNGVDLGIFINTNLLGPTNIWFDTNGDLLVSDYNGTAVKRFDSNGNFLGDFLTGLNQSEGVAIFPSGNILIGNGGNSSVKMFDSTGTYISDFIPSGSGNLINPNAVIIRQYNPIGIPEPLSDDISLFLSNIGSAFIFNKDIIHEIETITLYNMEGKLLEELDFGQSIWYANNYTPGKYVITANFGNGRIISQLLILQ